MCRFNVGFQFVHCDIQLHLLDGFLEYNIETGRNVTVIEDSMSKIQTNFTIHKEVQCIVDLL